MLSTSNIFSGSGNRSLYQSADRNRGLLIGSLRGIGLLRSRICIENDESDLNIADEITTEDLQAQWRRWRDVQQGRRLAWASFEYDCSVCTLTNRRGAVDMSELPAHLPCTDALWQASSAAAWKALFSQSSPAAKGPPQASLLRELLVRRNLSVGSSFLVKTSVLADHRATTLGH